MNFFARFCLLFSLTASSVFASNTTQTPTFQQKLSSQWEWAFEKFINKTYPYNTFFLSEEANKKAAQAYWQMKVNSIRFQESAKKVIYSTIVSPLLYPLSAYLNRNRPRHQQILAAFLIPQFFNYLFDFAISTWDNSVSDPKIGIASNAERITHAQAVIDCVEKSVPVCVASAFAQQCDKESEAN